MKRRKTKKRKGLIIISTTIVLGAAAVVSGYAYTMQQSYNNIIYPSVYVEEIDLSKKSLSEAEELVKKKYEQPIINKKILIQTDNKTYTLDFKKLEARYNISEIVKEAYNYGKDGSIIEKYKNIKNPSAKKFELSFAYNEKIIDDTINTIENELKKEAVNASISISKGNIKITPEKDGIKLNKDKLRQAIQEQIDKRLLAGDAKINAPLEATKPEITKEKLSAINTSIYSFNTNFSTSTANRANNIELATKAIDGTLLMPGETFSFNNVVGERTRARGYKEAGVIIGDKIESGLGGGICQVSSTLYNAILRTGIKSEERRNHSLPLAYVSKGLDATVDWGNIDYKFKNTLSYPIYIEGYVQSRKVYFNVYSSKELTKRTYDISSEVYETVQPGLKYTDDSSIPEGQVQVTKAGSPGYKVKVYRKTYENNKLVNTEVISNDFYRPVNGEALKGTKKS